MSKIELITQPADDENMSRSESLEATLEKLKKLVDDNPVPSGDDDDDEGVSAKEAAQEIRRSPSPTREFSHEKLKEFAGTEANKDDEDEQEYDDDGFAIPQGKIPIDGHFSTRELQELVEIAQLEGYLNDVDFKVVDHNETLGDKVVIADHDRSSEGKKYGEDEERKDAKKQKELKEHSSERSGEHPK
ncbi:uncharacterized protein CANTADRAFT_4856 [Suhomyces tanzawaensis NRRL Y-17324]|uniref:Uncharacterized protein n=1 Tax=Suhomyces tanzawaensis NRRL Y-17324 TaxID=984487 RepID=A0A1E4SMW4_9ASCO|nr:uncharacterized protein CANTADRAFT_4856 [Suhomyces tanzawaensis NRRL Y-17324]ODV80861.1 hypothetical protein CANTADRAFT_4856 [Suhomyces tanzawaensis NRRL Y-17324]